MVHVAKQISAVLGERVEAVAFVQFPATARPTTLTLRGVAENLQVAQSEERA